jgi:D-aminopeptidase
MEKCMDQQQQNTRPRARDLGISFGQLPTGPWNAITDVAGVRVGHTTLIAGDGPLVPGQGPVRTGVTVILPHGGNLFREKVPAAIHVVNGFGKCMGQEQIDELGTLEGPIALTNTMNVGLVTDAIIAWGIGQSPEIGITTSTINPVVGECSDSYLNDIQGRHVREEHVFSALERAVSGPVDEGAVGAGTGMSAFGYKGGIGTSSRVAPANLGGWTVGVLVLANYGRRDQLRIAGVPVGEALGAGEDVPERGSIMIVVATDAPLLDRGLRRLARRAGIGLARTGSIAGNGSGDYIIAFSSSESVRIPHTPSSLTLNVEIVVEDGPAIDALFPATVEATEEAIVNALFRATTIIGRDGNVREALPLDRVMEILASPPSRVMGHG